MNVSFQKSIVKEHKKENEKAEDKWFSFPSNIDNNSGKIKKNKINQMEDEENKNNSNVERKHIYHEDDNPSEEDNNI